MDKKMALKLDIATAERYQLHCNMCGMSIYDKQYIKLTEEIEEMKERLLQMERENNA